MSAPEDIGIETFEKLFERAAVGMSFHRRRRDGDYSFVDGSEAYVLLIDQDQAPGGAQQNLLLLGLLLLLQKINERLEPLARRGCRRKLLLCFFYGLRHALLVEGL